MYVVTDIGKFYSESIGFNTLAVPGAPIVTSNNISGIGLNEFSITGNVNYEGASPVFKRGFCWSINTNPTLADNTINAGQGSGGFSSKIINLKSNTIYFIRAFASNSQGTSYGEQLQVTTKSIKDLKYGDKFNGGILVYFLEPGDYGYSSNEPHGLILADTVISSVQWGCNNVSITTSNKIGYGKSNTDNILLNCSSPLTAANVCDKLILNGYDDWFMPSENELKKIFENYKNINIPISNRYWSSHAFSPQTASAVRPDGMLFNDLRTTPYSVLAVRQF